MLGKTRTQRARGGRAMKAYKFRASSQFDATLDIIFNRRLYCADWSRLNDPMEGRFVYAFSSGNGGDPNKEMGRIIREKNVSGFADYPRLSLAICCGRTSLRI